MTFSFLHSTHQETPIRIPQIGLDLLVRAPPETTSGGLTAIETTNAPGFGQPLHRHRETEVFCALESRYAVGFFWGWATSCAMARWTRPH